MDFWYPYKGMQDAARRIGPFANKAVNPSCGISWSDGHQVAVLRRAQPVGDGGAQWFNILRYQVSAPPPPPKPSQPSGFVAKAEAFFWSVMQAQGEAEIAEAQANQAAGEALYKGVRDNVWEPTHKFLLRHKVLADGIGVAIDVVGVIAGIAFVIGFAPEIGIVAAVAGFSAAAGSTLLAVADGRVFAAEATGHKALSEKWEHSSFTQWARLVGTVMTLADLPVGGVRSLAEIKALKIEAAEATEAAGHLDTAAAAARDRVAAIRNPGKHPGPVAYRMRRAKKLAQQAEAHRQDATALTQKARVTGALESFPAFGATPAGTALLAAAPPAMLLNQGQKAADDAYTKSLEPEGGMPHDVKLEVRISKTQKVAK